MSQRDGVAMDVRVLETVHLEVPGTNGAHQRIAITVESKSGQVARLRIRAGDSVTIKRPGRQEIPAAT